MTEKIQVIIPTITKDYMRMRDVQVEKVLEHLPVSELVFVGNDELCEIVNDDIARKHTGKPVKSLNEEELVERQPVIDYVKERVASIDPELVSRVRPGWYYQQFLKMAFADFCDGDHYMTWDMDTVPLRNVEMFDHVGHPVFDLKSEHNPGYFKTIGNLLGLQKNVDGSFVSEHMIFRKDYMKEMIDNINNSDIDGRNVWEKVINAIDMEYIALGFSEFETYGTFVTDRHPDAYGYRRFVSLRRGSWFLNPAELTDEDINWLKQDYDAITFENAAVVPDMAQLFRNPKYRNNMSAKKFYETILESGYFGEYSDGAIVAGDWRAPV